MIHPTQKKLMELSEKYDLEKMTLREIGKLIGVNHPQNVKYHLQKITITPPSKKVTKTTTKIVSLPILGMANCGDATMIADDLIEGFLRISKRLLPSSYDVNNLFIVQATGNSMNQASVNGKSIQDNDYVLIDETDKTASNGDYVLSIINGMANIKYFTEDLEHEQIILQSESSDFFPPIYIHKDDLDEYIINGKVIDVIKQPTHNDELRYETI